MLGIRDREKLNLEPRFERRQNLSMSCREREIVPDGWTSERKGTMSEMSCLCSEHEICDYQQRIGECVKGCTVQGGQKGKEEQCK